MTQPQWTVSTFIWKGEDWIQQQFYHGVHKEIEQNSQHRWEWSVQGTTFANKKTGHFEAIQAKCTGWWYSSIGHTVTAPIGNAIFFFSKAKFVIISFCFSEISLLKELQNHPNIVQIQNVFVNHTEVVLSFEYISMDLKTYMQRLPIDFRFPQVAIQSYLYQIVNGIAFCHQRRIFHRNLCPQNLFITSKGVIKVSLVSIDLRHFPKFMPLFSCRSPTLIRHVHSNLLTKRCTRVM